MRCSSFELHVVCFLSHEKPTTVIQYPATCVLVWPFTSAIPPFVIRGLLFYKHTYSLPQEQSEKSVQDREICWKYNIILNF